MALFLNEDVKQLLYNKFVVIIGDSVSRGMYKDLVAMLQGNYFLTKRDLKMKGEETFMNDKLLEGGTKAVMNNGVNYREVREYKTDTHLVRFYFVTRVHNTYWREVIFRDMCEEPSPDVIVMNSCLWDISRYGSVGMSMYKENLEKTFQTLAKVMPEDCICIWNTALPVANKIKGGFLLPELTSLCDTLRLDVLEANFYARKLAEIFEINVLDLNFFFRSLMGMQVGDGVHWNFKAHRRFTNFLLTHICKIWNIKLPHKFKLLKQNNTDHAEGHASQKSFEDAARIPTPPHCQDQLRRVHQSKPKPPRQPSSRWDKLPPPWKMEPSQRDRQVPPVGTYHQATDRVLYNDYASGYRPEQMPQQMPQQPVQQPVQQPQASYNPFYMYAPTAVTMGQAQYNSYTGLGQGLGQGLGLGLTQGLGQVHAGQFSVDQNAYNIYGQPTAAYQSYNNANSTQQYNQWYGDSSSRRHQRLMAERAYEIAGVMNYAGQQYRVQ